MRPPATWPLLVASLVPFLLPRCAIGWDTPSRAPPRRDRSETAASSPGLAGERNRVRERSPADPDRPDDAIPVKVIRYVRRLVKKYDRNGDGKLQPAEWSKMQGNPRLADSNHDGLITREELTGRVVQYGRYRRIRPLRGSYWDDAVLEPLLQATTEPDAADAPDGRPSPAGDHRPGPAPDSPTDPSSDEEVRRESRFVVPPSALPKGLPDWFVPRDTDGDGQVTMAEFAPRASSRELERFAWYDTNHDGVITAEECLRAAKAGKEKTAP